MNRPPLGARFIAPRGLPETDGWHPASALFGPHLTQFVAEHRRARHTEHTVAAASLLFCQYVNQVTGPVLARYWLDGRGIDAAAANTWVHLTGGRLTDAAFTTAPAQDRPGADDTLAWLMRRMVEDNLAHAVDAWHRITRVGRRTLWGNVASGIATAMRAISWTQPDPARFVAETESLLEHHPATRGLCCVNSLPVGGHRWQTHHRNSCCLMFKTGDGGFCATCPVVPAPDRVARVRRMIDETP
ncbi:IucA/IucC family C-terminal-domain containing protein [Dactylosporangium sp. NPDC051484]|uniref:IucA/IucC family C-terminal-domain containing protein n=1 Tax=Dactylosporangium sp. NPDC051484 TaxID=3154942 RepID=UPI00344E1D1E